jgi:serine/threonine-protein kinase
MHGDVKPSNMMISPEGHVTLLDLGFARRNDETGSAVDRCVMGTCHYLAPEWITSALRPDIRSDIYSLGVVLFELFAGRLPFRAQDLAELAQQHKEAAPPDLRRLVPHLPTDVVHLVGQMMAKQPLRRPQKPRELIDRLVRLEIATFSERSWATVEEPLPCGQPV